MDYGRTVREFMLKHGMVLRGTEYEEYLNKNPEKEEYWAVSLEATRLEGSTAKRFTAEIAIINNRLMKTRDSHDYDVRVTISARDGCNFTENRELHGNDLEVLFTKALKIVDSAYKEWSEGNLAPKTGLWRWALLIPAVGVLLLNRSNS